MTPFFVDLYINGLPVNYSISFNENVYEFEPIFNPHEDLEAPFFTLSKTDKEWIMSDVEDLSIKSQALEYLKIPSHFKQWKN